MYTKSKSREGLNMFLYEKKNSIRMDPQKILSLELHPQKRKHQPT